MEQQVIKELIELTGGGIHVDFDDPIKVKMSPHSYPEKITAVRFDHNGVYLVINKEEKKWSDVNVAVQNTITQRLRLMVHLKQNV